jgi:TRAP-type C4-dicarboxylate transport system permease small subunit
MRILYEINARMNSLFEKLLFVSFSTMAILVFFQVVFRYVVEMPLAWTEEAARYLLVWSTYLGACIAFHEGTHINATLFVDLLPHRIRAFFLLLADIACLAFLVLFAVEGAVVTQRVFMLGQFSPSMPWLPIGCIYLVIPLCSFFMTLNVAAYALRHLAAVCNCPDRATDPAQNNT